MKSFLKRNIYPLILFAITLVLFFANYKPGTFLIGWDNLFPEFDFRLNFTRDLFAVWQQYRGLGALDNFAQASNLLHDLYRLVISTFLPNDMVRWVFVFIAHFTGGLGAYYLIIHLLKHDKNLPAKGFIAFFGALFYQYNLGTIQQFFLPFEAFIIHFAFLPWLFLSAINYYERGDKKSLIVFFLVSLLATPQAFIPTLFAVYFIGISIFFLSSLAFNRFHNMRRVLVLLTIIIVSNLFWILPAGYSFLTYSKTVANAKNYQMASNDIFYRNKKYGDFLGMAQIRGVVLDFQSTDYKSNSSHYMMWPWLKHMNTGYFQIPAWIFFFIGVLGVVFAIKNRDKKHLPFLVLFLFAYLMMGTDIPIINIPSQLLRQYIPLFNVIFRFTFTKFSLLYAMGYAIVLAFGLTTIFKIFSDKKKTIAAAIVLMLFIGSYSFPAFRGNFFYENLGVKIPKDYFRVFDYLGGQYENSRIAVLPIPWYWAWLQPKWGTINSGFIWYGIPQSVTDLAFTPWGSANENYHWELEQAIFSKDPILLENVLNKYNINWVYLDKNILNEPGRKMTYENYQELLTRVSYLESPIVFGQVELYRYKPSGDLNNFIGVKSNLKSVGPTYKYDNYDQSFIDSGDYYTSEKNQIIYPFRSLFSGKNPSDVEYDISEDNDFIYFKGLLPEDMSVWNLESPEAFQEEFSITDKNQKTIAYRPELILDTENIVVKINKKTVLAYDNQNDTGFFSLNNEGCGKNPAGTSTIDYIDTAITFTSIGSHNCIKIPFPFLSQRYGYLFNIKTVNDDKRGLLINLTNNTTDRIDLETYTDNDGQSHNYYLIIPPRGFYDLGYDLYFNNISEGNEKVVNTLERITVYQIPYYFLKNIRYVKNEKNSKTQDDIPAYPVVIQRNFSHYDVEFKTTSNDSILYLSQSYNPGWIAFADTKKLDHVLVNNWANGWRLPESTANTTKVVIIFWPQYLEFLGFILLAVAALRILSIKK
jgi:hypothetical protein